MRWNCSAGLCVLRACVFLALRTSTTYARISFLVRDHDPRVHWALLFLNHVREVLRHATRLADAAELFRRCGGTTASVRESPRRLIFTTLVLAAASRIRHVDQVLEITWIGYSALPSVASIMLATAVLGMVLAAYTAAWLALLGRFWYLRNKFEIRSRSPTLVLVAGLATFIFSSSVLWHWLLRSVGKTLPCWVVFVVSYTSEPATDDVYCSIYFTKSAVKNQVLTKKSWCCMPKLVQALSCRVAETAPG